MLGLDFTVMASSFEEREQVDPTATPAEQVMAAARGKAEEVFRLTARAPETADGLVIGADTIVVLEGGILGKPTDQAEAGRMLRALSGRWHQVFTGLALLHRDKAITAMK